LEVRAQRTRTAHAVALLPILLFHVSASFAELPTPRLPQAIPEQPLDSALREFARTTQLQIIYVTELTAHRKSGSAAAGMTTAEGLTSILGGNGLKFQFLNDHTVKIYAAPASTIAAVGVPSGSSPTPMNEVVVTAERGEEELQHVPQSIVAWTASEINAIGARDFSDVAIRTPGVEYDFYPDLGPGTHTNIAIRGIDARDGTATAVYLDDVPLRPDPSGTIGRALPLLTDLERVEVLRGPQSTLLGEGAEGGVLRFFTTAPSLTSASGYARVDASVTARGGPGFLATAAANQPLVQDRLAIRASAGYQSDGGYIDRVDPFTLSTVDRNVNRATAQSARVALSWAPADEIRVTPSFTYQRHYLHDSPAFYVALSDPPQGVLRSGKLLQQPTDDEFTVGSVKAAFAFDGLELTSTTSHFHRTVYSVTDATNNGLNWGSRLGPEYPASDQTWLKQSNTLRQSEWGQELRLTTVAPLGRLSWLVGAFVLHATYREETVTPPALNANGVQVGDTDLTDEGRETHLALFGDLSWQLTDRLTAQAGVRVTHSTYEATVPASGDPPGRNGYVTPSGDESPVAPRITLSYQQRPEVLYYATISTGYRLGGVNPPIQPWCSVHFPAAYGPDWVTNYELGSKASVFEGRANVAASIYHMTWQHLQTDLNEPDPGCFTYIVNVGAAASDGFELSADALLGESVHLGLAAAYTHARYTETILDGEQIRARAGDTLGSIPVVPSPWSVTGYAEYNRALGDRCRTSLVAEDIFHSRNQGPFYSLDPTSPNYDPAKRPDPSNNLLNLRASLLWTSLELRLFLDNALDSQPTLLRRNAFVGSTFFVATTFRPRTLGISIVGRY
jgi:outer membrane receptor protein involved in Fe transport